MKKHMGGFVPVDYEKAGKWMLGFGVILIILAIVQFVLTSSSQTVWLIVLGIVLVMLGVYLIKYVPND